MFDAGGLCSHFVSKILVSCCDLGFAECRSAHLALKRMYRECFKKGKLPCFLCLCVEFRSLGESQGANCQNDMCVVGVCVWYITCFISYLTNREPRRGPEMQITLMMWQMKCSVSSRNTGFAEWVRLSVFLVNCSVCLLTSSPRWQWVSGARGRVGRKKEQ